MRARRRPSFRLVLLIAAVPLLIDLSACGGDDQVEPVISDVRWPSVRVPRLKGLAPAAASELVRASYLVPAMRGKTVPKGGKWRVVAQRPRAGSMVTMGDDVMYRVVHFVKVPELHGLSMAEAATLLHAAGLYYWKWKIISSTKPAGTVLMADPPPGTFVTEGSQVKLWLAGKHPVHY